MSDPKPNFQAAATRQSTEDRVYLVAEPSGPEGQVSIFRKGQPEPTRIARLPADATAPAEDLPPIAASQVVALDVLEHVLDEDAWLTAFANMLHPGGTLVVRVPLEGPIAWLDALNMYRYVQDTIGVGKDLQETRLKGWHRHYEIEDLRTMLSIAGFNVASVRRSGSPGLDVAQFGALAWGGLVRRTPSIEPRVRAWRDRLETGRDLPALGPISSKVTVTATRRQYD